MGVTLQLFLILEQRARTPQAMAVEVLRRMDQAGLRYHYQSKGHVQLWKSDGSGGDAEEGAIPLGDPSRVARAAEHLVRQDAKCIVEMTMDCGSWKTWATLSLQEAGPSKGLWVLELRLDDDVSLAEQDGMPNCRDAFLLSGVAPLLDSGVALMGWGGVEVEPLPLGQLEAIRKASIPDLFEYNLYGPLVFEKYGNALISGIKKWGKVLVETPQGTVIWEFKLPNRAFAASSPAERLRLLGAKMAPSS